MDHPSNLLRHPLQLGCSRSEIKGEEEVVGEVMVYLVELVSEVVVDWVVVLLVVPLMRLSCHPSIPRHLPKTSIPDELKSHPFSVHFSD